MMAIKNGINDNDDKLFIMFVLIIKKRINE